MLKQDGLNKLLQDSMQTYCEYMVEQFYQNMNRIQC